MSLYSKEIIRHFRAPKNVGKIKNPDGVGEAGNLLCGDLMKFYLRIGKDKKGKERIEDIKFETLGCAVAIANSSLLCSLVKGKKLDEALRIKKEDLIKKLGKPLPPFKIHCSMLAVDALKEAVYDYFKRNKKEVPESLKEAHQRIIKTKKEIEKRYRKFRLLEKRILK